MLNCVTCTVLCFWRFVLLAAYCRQTVAKTVLVGNTNTHTSTRAYSVYSSEFAEMTGREPGKADKEPLRSLYARYKLLRSLCESTDVALPDPDLGSRALTHAMTCVTFSFRGPP